MANNISNKARAEGEVRSEFLKEVDDIINCDRAAEYGSSEESFGFIANCWGNFLGIGISPADVAAMMTYVKLARLRQNTAHADSWKDLAGYAALGYQLTR